MAEPNIIEPKVIDLEAVRESRGLAPARPSAATPLFTSSPYNGARVYVPGLPAFGRIVAQHPDGRRQLVQLDHGPRRFLPLDALTFQDDEEPPA